MKVAATLNPNPESRKFFIDNLLVRIQFIIAMILVDRPCAMGVFQVALYLPSSQVNVPCACGCPIEATLHSTLYDIHIIFYTLHSALYALHSTLYTPHSTLYKLHSTRPTPYTSHHTPDTLHPGLDTRKQVNVSCACGCPIEATHECG